MKRIKVVGGLFVLAAAGTCVAGAAQAIKEGKWAMSMTVQNEAMGDAAADAAREMEQMSPEERAMMERMMGGMKVGPHGQGMTIQTSQCLTNDRPVPTRDDQRGCEETHTTEGNAVTFKVVCPKSTSEGTIAYSGDTMQGTITTTETKRGQPVTTTMSINGRYEGPC
jgi:hypothetical protein